MGLKVTKLYSRTHVFYIVAIDRFKGDVIRLTSIYDCTPTIWEASMQKDEVLQARIVRLNRNSALSNMSCSIYPS